MNTNIIEPYLAVLLDYFTNTSELKFDFLNVKPNMIKGSNILRGRYAVLFLMSVLIFNCWSYQHSK